MRIFIFTGGGLAPALNPTIYGVLKACRERGWETIGGLFGWASLLRNGRHVDLNDINITALRNVGGTLLRSSRTNPLAIENGIRQVKERLQELQVDAIVAIGGNDTLGAAAELAQTGIPVVGIPKTIDNDLAGTYFTPGFPTAAHYLANLTREIKEDAAYALSRIFVIESMGMKAGWLTAAACYGGADVIIPPDQTVSLRRTLDLLSERYSANGNYAVVVVAQEAKFDEPIQGIAHHELGEQYGHTRQSFICLQLKDKINTELGIGTKAIYPGNFLETGLPIALDRDLAIALGGQAIRLIEAGNYGQMACVIRPDPEAVMLSVDSTRLRHLAQQDNYRPFPPEYFDYQFLQTTPAFLDYMEPLLGRCQPTDDEYTKLIKRMTSRL